METCCPTRPTCTTRETPSLPSKFDAVALVLDVGISSNSSGFLKSGLRCASELLQRKLFSESPDRFGLVLVGTEKAENPLGYEGVTLLDERGLSVADWQLLDFVQNHIQGKIQTCDRGSAGGPVWLLLLMR